MKRRKLIATITLSTIALIFSTRLAFADSKKEIVVATDSDTAPFTYKKDDSYRGYDIDVLKAVFKDSKTYQLKFQTVAFSSILSGIDSGRYQIAANDFNYNEERAEKYLFSNPISKSNYAIVSEKGTKYTSLDELSGKTAEAMAGSNYAQILEKWNADNQDKSPITINYVSNGTGLSNRLQNIENKKTDFILYDAISAQFVVKDQGFKVNVNKVSDTIGTKNDGLEYFVFAKDKEGKVLQNFVNKRLDNLQKNGTLKKLSQKYFGGDFVTSLK